MMAHREIRVAPDAPGRELLMAEMRAFEYLPDGRFRRMEARAGQHDDAVMAVALGAYLAQRMRYQQPSEVTGSCHERSCEGEHQ